MLAIHMERPVQFHAGPQRCSTQDAGQVGSQEGRDFNLLAGKALQIEIRRPGQHAEIDHDPAGKPPPTAVSRVGRYPCLAVGVGAQPGFAEHARQVDGQEWEGEISRPLAKKRKNGAQASTPSQMSTVPQARWLIFILSL